MRRFGIGLMLAMATLMAASASYAKDKDVSADVAPLVVAAKLPCTPTASRFIAEGQMADKVHAKFYEVACQEGLGYVLISRDKDPAPQNIDCLTAGQPGPDGKKGNLACALPANANPMAGLQPIITKAGQNCAIVKTRVLGSSADRSYFELACDGGAGFILAIPRAVGGPAVQAINCISLDGSGNIKCEYYNRDQVLTTAVTQLVTASGKPCVVKDKRYVGQTQDGSDFYEVACQAGDGYMLQASAGPKLVAAIGCANATQIAGGCTLTDSRAAQTQQSALYTSLAKKSGFNCDVAKYGVFPANGETEVVELQCSNRPDGGVGVFPLHGGKPMVYDCLRSVAEGYKCSYSDDAVLYPKLSAQLVAKGKGSCVVNGARAYGKTATSELVEVSCSDGGPGWVIEYPQFATEPSSLLNCAQAGQIGAGGCQLPTNKKKG